MVTIRSPFCGYNTAQCAQIKAKIYRVIQIKLNQLVYVHMITPTYQQSVFKRYHRGKHFSEFSPTRWRQKSTGIDMKEQQRNNAIKNVSLTVFFIYCVCLFPFAKFFSFLFMCATAYVGEIKLYIYTVSQKKQDTKLLPITSPNVNRFSKLFHW